MKREVKRNRVIIKTIALVCAAAIILAGYNYINKSKLKPLSSSSISSAAEASTSSVSLSQSASSSASKLSEASSVKDSQSSAAKTPKELIVGKWSGLDGDNKIYMEFTGAGNLIITEQQNSGNVISQKYELKEIAGSTNQIKFSTGDTEEFETINFKGNDVFELNGNIFERAAVLN